MKNIFGLITFMMLISSTCLAMTFSQPQKFNGYITHAGDNFNGFIVKDVINNQGNIIKRINNTSFYDRGIAKFGNGEDALYAHYDIKKDMQVHFGNKNYNNTFPIWFLYILPSHSIYKIYTNTEVILYLICSGAELQGGEGYYILGRRNDGIFVKYIDTDIIARDYFGAVNRKNNLGIIPSAKVAFNMPIIKNDSIIIEYLIHQGRGVFKKSGEFRFKWDDAAQWFGIEQVVY